MQLSWAVIKVKSLAWFLSLLSICWNECRSGSKGEHVTGEKAGSKPLWNYPLFNLRSSWTTGVDGGKGMFWYFLCCTPLSTYPINPFGLLGAAGRSRMSVLWGAFKKEKGAGSLLSSSPSVLSISSTFSLPQGSLGGRCCCNIPFTFSPGLLMPCCRSA